MDEEAWANKEVLGNKWPDLAASWGDAIQFVLPLVTSSGDSGGGFFTAGKLAGMHYGPGIYQRVDTRNLYGRCYSGSYEIPPWPYADWIQKTINDEGTSGAPPAHDRPRPTTLLRLSFANTDPFSTCAP